MKTINSILVLAILIGMLASCAAAPQGVTCSDPAAFQTTGRITINRATAMYVAAKLGQEEPATAEYLIWQQWKLVENLNCEGKEAELVLTVLKNTLWATQAENTGADPRIINIYIEHGYNAMRELVTVYQWEGI